MSQLAGEEWWIAAMLDVKAAWVAEVTRLREALAEYGDHDPECDWIWDKGVCDCGFDAALSAPREGHDG